MIEPKDCDVLLFAAGFGKRLLPLTANKPKPLLEVKGKSLIEWNLLLLSRAGFDRVFINLHYLGDQIRAQLGDGSRWGMELLYSEEPLILDTGGGIKNIEPLLRRPQLVTVNSDTLFGHDFSFVPLFKEQEKGARATLVVRQDEKAKFFGSLFVDGEGQVIQFLDASRPDAGDATLREVMYAGIQIMERSLIAEMPASGTVFSLTKETFRTVVRSGQILRTCRYDGYWSDVGTPERLDEASKSFAG